MERCVLRCTACGAQGSSPCSCGKLFVYVSAGEAARCAVMAHPEKSDRAIAASLGISHMSVKRARFALGVTNVTDSSAGSAFAPESNSVDPNSVAGVSAALGSDTNVLDPKPVRRAGRRVSAERGVEIARAVLDGGVSRKVVAARFGVSDTVVRRVVAEERGRRAAEPVVTMEMVTNAADCKKLEAMRERLEATFEDRVEEETQRRIAKYMREIFMPRLAEREADAKLVLRSRRGVFTESEYKAIIKCLHPDVTPDGHQRTEAFRLFTDRKVALLSEKDFNKTYTSLPLAADFLQRGRHG